jgi:hypothetical protein
MRQPPVVTVRGFGFSIVAVGGEAAPRVPAAASTMAIVNRMIRSLSAWNFPPQAEPIR